MKQIINEQVKSILENIEVVAYYDVDAYVTRKIDEFRAYLLKRHLEVVTWEGHTVLVDFEALRQKANLNCFECTKHYETGCCCGSPCSYSKRNLEVFNAHKSQIIKELIRLEPKRYAQLLEHQVNEMSAEELMAGKNLELEIVDENGIIKSCGERCYLLVREEGISKCLTHKYALEHQLSIYEISPLSCLMFPIELIALITKEGEEILLITSVIEDDFAKRYGRWGNYKGFGIPFTCVEFAAHNEYFKEKDYKPLYEVSKGLIIHEFGEAVYKKIEEICQ